MYLKFLKALKNSKLYLESLLIITFVFALIGLFSFIPFNFHLLNIKEAFKDLDLTDIYFSKVKSSEIQDTSVVIIDIDKMTRSEIADLLITIKENNPSTIGLDAYFQELKDSAGDAKLKSAFQEVSDKLVLAGFYTFSNQPNLPENKPQWIGTNPYFGSYESGYYNFVGEHEINGTIRYFKPTQDSKKAFAVEVISKGNPAKASDLLSRKKDSEMINYVGNYDQFINFYGPDVLGKREDISIIKDKIVLLGYAGNVRDKMWLEDSHFTPLNDELASRSLPDMYGVVIHANIISMVMRGDYINKVSGFWDFFMALIIGILHVILYVYFFVRKHIWFHLVAKFSQLITSVLLVGLVLLVMHILNLKFQPGLTLGVILLSVDVLYFYEGFMSYLYKKYSLKSFFIHEH